MLLIIFCRTIILYKAPLRGLGFKSRVRVASKKNEGTQHTGVPPARMYEPTWGWFTAVVPLLAAGRLYFLADAFQNRENIWGYELLLLLLLLLLRCKGLCYGNTAVGHTCWRSICWFGKFQVVVCVQIFTCLQPPPTLYRCTLIVVAEREDVGGTASDDNQRGVTLVTAAYRKTPPRCLDSAIHHTNLLNSILAS